MIDPDRRHSQRSTHDVSTAMHPDGDGTLVVTIRGDIDLTSVSTIEAGLRPALDPGVVSAIVLDLEAAAFMDSSGIALVLDLRDDRCARRGLALAAPSAPIRRVLELVGLEDLRVAGSVGEAVDQLTSANAG